MEQMKAEAAAATATAARKAVKRPDVNKYRATKASEGDGTEHGLKFPVGAVVLVIGDPGKDGTAKAVYGGVIGAAPMSHLERIDHAPLADKVQTVTKYRALETHTGDISFPPGATLFVMGEPNSSGMVKAVFAGATGMCPAKKLIVATEYKEPEKTPKPEESPPDVVDQEEDEGDEDEGLDKEGSTGFSDDEEGSTGFGDEQEEASPSETVEADTDQIEEDLSKVDFGGFN